MDTNRIIGRDDDEDVEGHSIRIFLAPQDEPGDDVEGHVRSRVDSTEVDDTDGHIFKVGVQPRDTDDVEGHRATVLATGDTDVQAAQTGAPTESDDEDTEGHRLSLI